MRNRKSYNGGKGGSGVYQQIISLIPHGMENFIEGFAGSAAISRYLKLPKRIVLCEINRQVLNEIELPNVQNIERVHDDFFMFVRSEKHSEMLNSETTVLYLDPPYPREVRVDKKKKLYTVELFESFDPGETGIHTHEELLKIALGLKCRVMISSYDNELYNKMLTGWSIHKFWTTDRAGRRRQEVVWYNFERPERLYDHRYLGKDDRERWRINKRRNRLRNKFMALNAQERWALYDTLTETMFGKNKEIDNASERPERETVTIDLFDVRA